MRFEPGRLGSRTKFERPKMNVPASVLAEPASSAAPGVAQVLFFGRIADVCGPSIRAPVPEQGCLLSALKARIAERIDGGEEALCEPCVRVAIDQVMTRGDPWVLPGQEVAFLSAFSGG
jgi:molybdopterin converting factor small subunit